MGIQEATRSATAKTLCVVFFVSGVSALIFENLWFRLAGLTFGNSVWAGAVVLSSFMCGLALGNGLAVFWLASKLRRPIRSYSLLELVIAVTGTALVFAFPMLTAWLSPLFRTIADSPWIINPLRLGISFVLMMVPATAMGMTLPLLVKALYDDSPNFGTVLGRLYGWNTLGALVGALLPDAVLIGAFGITGTGLVAGSLNLLAAAAAFYVSRTETVRRENDNVTESRWGRLPCMRLLAAGFLSGGILLGLEVVWFRFLILFFNAYSIAFAIMLAVVLGAIGLGGIVGSLWFRVQPQAHRYLVPLALLAGASSIGAYTLFGSLSALLPDNPYQWVYIFCLSFPLMFPVSLVSGILFTLVGSAVHEHIGGSIESTGLLTMVNTAGATLGSALAGFVLLPFMGMERSFFWLSISYAGVALLCLRREQWGWAGIGSGGLGAGRVTGSYESDRLSGPLTDPMKPRGCDGTVRQIRENIALRSSLLATAVVFISAVWWFPFGSMQQHIMSVGRKEAPGKRDWKCLAIRENLTETSQYWQDFLLGKPLYTRLFTNNHPMSTTRVLTKRYMNFFVYWPVALHPNPKDALLICFGVGATAKALTDTKALQSIDVVDTSKNILADSALVFPHETENPLYDPRVKVHVEDGRFFLQTTNRRFDIITGEPPPPLVAGVVNLYSQEYFQLIHDRLRDGGMVTYWLPVWQIPWSATKSILKAFSNVFEDCSLWNGVGFEWMMVGVRKPGSRVSEDEFAAQWRDPTVRPQITDVGFEIPEQIGTTFLMDATALRDWTKDALPLVDNYPARIFGKPEDSYMYTLNDLEDVMRAYKPAETFLKSSFISKLWPESVRMQTAEYFPFQELIHRAVMNPGHPHALPDMDALHKILTQSTLRFSVFLLAGGPDMLDANHVVQTLDEKEGQTEPGISFHLGVNALADRDFARAAQYFEMEQDESLQPSLVFYRAYSLCMTGQRQQAEDLLRGKMQVIVNRFGTQQVTWLRDTFGLALNF